MSALLGDPRDVSRVRHSRREQLRQRVYQICLGYEDCNDADWLRHDPVLQLGCGSEGRPLSSQPTLSRFETAVAGRELNRLWREFERDYVDALAPTTELVVFDVDATDDETHGDQQLSFFHGFYDHHMFHPLLVFDALSGQLITALLRSGRAHAAKGATSILTRLIRAIRRHCPRAQILVRGDSVFAMPSRSSGSRSSTRSSAMSSTSSVSRRTRALLDLAAPLRASAAEQFDDRGQFVRRFTWLSYASKSWPSQRAVICKVEHSSKGENPRFVVTAWTASSAASPSASTTSTGSSTTTSARFRRRQGGSRGCCQGGLGGRWLGRLGDARRRYAVTPLPTAPHASPPRSRIREAHTLAGQGARVASRLHWR